MEYRIQPIDNVILRMELPQYVIRVLNKESSVCFVAAENNEIIGFAVFDRCYERKNFMSLTYVYIKEQYRGKGVSIGLLSYAENCMREKGIKGIYSKIIREINMTAECCAYMLKQQYVPVVVEGHYLSYFIQDLRECIFAGKIKEMEKIISRVKFYKEVPKQALRKFAVNNTECGHNIDFGKIDVLFSSFYIENEEIYGFLHLDEIEENVLLLTDSYIKKDNGLILAAMLANALKISIATLPDEAMLCLQIYKENEYRGVKTVFGEAEHDELIMEYVKLL